MDVFSIFLIVSYAKAEGRLPLYLNQSNLGDVSPFDGDLVALGGESCLIENCGGATIQKLGYDYSSDTSEEDNGKDAGDFFHQADRFVGSGQNPYSSTYEEEAPQQNQDPYEDIRFEDNR